MTSQINSSTIDGTFPVAGKDNSSAGFRNNFSNIATNFGYAASEISDLQNKVILKSALSGISSTNDMQGTAIYNASVSGFRLLNYDIGNLSGAYVLDFNLGSFQTVTLAGSSVLSINTANSNWPATGFATLTLAITVPNTNYTLGFSGTANYSNIVTLAGYKGAGVIHFAQPGTYIFDISSSDGATNVYIQDLYRNREVVQGNLYLRTSNSNVTTTGITMTVETVGAETIGNITASNFIGNLISAGNSASYTGSVTADTVTANTAIYGNILTPIQSNITLLGTLSSLSVSGNANVGNVTVSGMSDACGGDMYGTQFVTATNGGSTPIYSNVGFALINPSTATIASHTIIMPATPGQGQVLRIGFANTITTLTHSGAGSDTVYGALSTANTNQGGTWIYHKDGAVNSGNGVWYRIG
jgi:hypothetical protein